MLKTVLSQWAPRRTASVLLMSAGIRPDRRAAQCSKRELTEMVGLLKRLRFHVARPRPVEEAMVTGGGVELADVDSRTMRSRLLAGLHFAGEVLDVQGPCGGFNLQAAFSTGYLAGESVEVTACPS